MLAPLLAPRRSFVRVSELTPTELRELLQNRSLVHIGGQHRGGTTLLWRGLAAHPSCASQYGGVAAGDAADLAHTELHGEGIFLQDVLPTHGLDHSPAFFARKRALAAACLALAPALAARDAWLRAPRRRPAWCRLREGIGSYALGREAARLAAGAHALARDPAAALLLFSEWAAHWDLAKPVLLEKSPSNALALGALAAGWAAAGPPRSVRFALVTRHPIAQALAMRAFVDDLSLLELLENWLAVEEAARAVVRARAASGERGAVALVSLEGLAARPERTLARLLCCLGVEPCDGGGGATAPAAGVPELPAAAARWVGTVRPRPNDKYEDAYVDMLRRGGARAEAEHGALVADFGSRVAAVAGYDLDAGVLDIARARGGRATMQGGMATGFGAPPLRTTLWLRDWVDHEESTLGVVVVDDPS